MSDMCQVIVGWTGTKGTQGTTETKGSLGSCWSFSSLSKGTTIVYTSGVAVMVTFILPAAAPVVTCVTAASMYFPAGTTTPAAPVAASCRKNPSMISPTASAPASVGVSVASAVSSSSLTVTMPWSSVPAKTSVTSAKMLVITRPFGFISAGTRTWSAVSTPVWQSNSKTIGVNGGRRGCGRDAPHT